MFQGSFYAQLEVLAILKGGAKSFHSLKGRVHKRFNPVLTGVHNKFCTRDFPIL